MIVMRKGMRSLGMDGQGGFEMLKMAFAYTCPSIPRLLIPFLITIIHKPLLQIPT
jgi:hypothetical protein